MSWVPDLSKTKVLVIGDVMLDRYWHGDTNRISPEAPVPVVNIQNTEERPGGAANVALNIASLGAGATLVGIIGDDESGRLLKHKLTEQNVNCALICEPTFPTITKLRVLGRHQQLIRLDFEKLFTDIAINYSEQLTSQIKFHDVVILSDYAKGVLSDPQRLITAAKKSTNR